MGLNQGRCRCGCEALGLSQRGTSKHLKVLREAGLVRVRPEAQRRWYELRPEPLAELDAWLAPYRRCWLVDPARCPGAVSGRDARCLRSRPRGPEDRTATSLREDGGAALRIERSLARSPEKVRRALTEPSHLNQWFPFDVEAELAVGGTVRFVDKAGGPPTSGVITELEPPRMIAYIWADDHLRWELLPADGGCTLVLTHTVADHGCAGLAIGWHACIDALEHLLAGGRWKCRVIWTLDTNGSSSSWAWTVAS